MFSSKFSKNVGIESNAMKKVMLIYNGMLLDYN
jgi:hypothetical protein